MLAFSVPTTALFGAGKLNELHTQINTPMGAVHGTKALVVISSGKSTRANGDLGRLAAEAGVHVDYIASIQMVDNYLPVFDMDEQMSLDKHVEEQLTAAVQAVSRRERGISEATEEGRKLHAQVTAMNRRRKVWIPLWRIWGWTMWISTCSTSPTAMWPGRGRRWRRPRLRVRSGPSVSAT